MSDDSKDVVDVEERARELATKMQSEGMREGLTDVMNHALSVGLPAVRKLFALIAARHRVIPVEMSDGIIAGLSPVTEQGSIEVKYYDTKTFTEEKRYIVAELCVVDAAAVDSTIPGCDQVFDFGAHIDELKSHIAPIQHPKLMHAFSQAVMFTRMAYAQYATEDFMYTIAGEAAPQYRILQVNPATSTMFAGDIPIHICVRT